MNADQIWRAIESRVLRAIQGYKPSSLVTFPVPVSYTPVWAATGTQPSIGDGTLNGRYVLRGKMCLVDIHLLMGSTTTYGSGNWSFTIPFAAASAGVDFLGEYVCTDVSGNRYTRTAVLVGGGTALAYSLGNNDANLYLTPTYPFTWAAGDILRIQAEYEIE